MANELCAHCDKPIPPVSDKTTVQDVPYHMACWDKKQRGR